MSSVIRTFHYDPAEKALIVTFRTGKRYAYSGVPAEVVSALRSAASLGTFFNAAIRDHYPFERLR
ncbi:KTSC domain-containing protein [Sphingomonas sp.]|uniref:KTSC domain-containing protein n=1 Tax=Sphingomonas sp. TaxID=28214 RepID=UPI003B3A2E16